MATRKIVTMDYAKLEMLAVLRFHERQRGIIRKLRKAGFKVTRILDLIQIAGGDVNKAKDIILKEMVK